MSDIIDILDSLEPEEVLVELGVEYRLQSGRSGEQLNVQCCPRCKGNSWKVFLNAETGLGNCFHGSCVGEPGFNMYSFTKAELGSSKETMKLFEMLAKGRGWKKKRVKTVMKATIAVTLDSSLLPNSVELPYKGSVGKYLKSRGFDNETAEYFHWRYCLDGKYDYLFQGESKQQNFSKRIIIPVLNLKGELATFQGRDITDLAKKKYLFPSGLPGTSLYLYNGHNALKSKEIVINEGALDVAATLQAFKADPLLQKVIPVGTFGKNLSTGRSNGEDQLGALLALKSQGLEQVTFMWDSEPKALRDAADAAIGLGRYGFKVRVAVLPPNSDPNEATPVEVRTAYRQSISVTTRMEYIKFLAKLKSLT